MSDKQDTSHYELALDKVDLPATADAILDVLRRILAKSHVQSISIRSKEPIEVSWYRPAGEQLLELSIDLKPDAVLASIDISDSEFEGTARECLFRAFEEITNSALVPTHILCNNNKMFRKWLGIPPVFKQGASVGRSFPQYLGLCIVPTELIPTESVLVCGSRARGEDLRDIVYGVRVLTGVTDD